MRIFKAIETDFSLVGINRYNSVKTYPRLSARNLIFLFLSAYNAISVMIHIIYDDNSFEDYIDSAYKCSGMCLASVIFSIFIYETQRLHEFINKLERTAQHSEYMPFQRKVQNFV